MGRVSFTQELNELAQQVGEGMDAGGCWREVISLHRELGRHENALGRAAWTMRYGQRREWRSVLREGAAETLREARRAASVYDDVRLREAASCYARLAGCWYAEAAELTLTPGERAGSSPAAQRKERRLEHVALEVRWTVERPKGNGQRRRGRGRIRQRSLVAA
jgi:hypothetical protein